MTREELGRLHVSCKVVLQKWIELLRAELGPDGFPEQVTAFHDAMAVHGRYGKPCPVCETKVQRIAYANNETNYCPTCQTGGKLLAYRGLSRLPNQDWPKTPEELQDYNASRNPAPNRLALNRFAPNKLAPQRRAFRKLAPCRFTSRRSTSRK